MHAALVDTAYAGTKLCGRLQSNDCSTSWYTCARRLTTTPRVAMLQLEYPAHGPASQPSSHASFLLPYRLALPSCLALCRPSLKATMDAGLSVQPSNRVLSLLATMDSVRSTPSGEDNAMLVKQARTGSTTQLLPLEQARGSHPVLSGEGLRVPYVRSTSERAGARLLAALAELQGGQAAAEQEGVGSGSSTLMRVQDSSTLERIRESTMEMRSSLPAFVSPTNAKRRMSMLRESYRTAESHSEQLHRTPTDPPPAAATPRALQRRLASMEAADGDAAPMVSGLTHSVTAASLKGTIDSLRGTNESEYGSCCNNLASSSGVGLDSELALLLGSSNSTREGEELSDDEQGEGDQAGQGQEGSEVWHEVQLLLVKDPATDTDVRRSALGRGGRGGCRTLSQQGKGPRALGAMAWE